MPPEGEIRIEPDKPVRPFFRLHLSTGVALVFVAGFLLYANTATYTYQSWPGQWSTAKGFPLDFSCEAAPVINGISFLWLCSLAWYVMEERIERKSPISSLIFFIGLGASLPFGLFLSGYFCNMKFVDTPKFWGRGWPFPVLVLQREDGQWTDFPGPLGALANLALGCGSIVGIALIASGIAFATEYIVRRRKA